MLFLMSSGLLAQTLSNDNFVYTTSPKKAVQAAGLSSLTKDEMSQSVTYFDGLGRPVQTTAINQGINGADIITPVEYDGFGRQVKEYLPYALSNGTTTYPRIAMSSSTASLNTFYNTSNTFSLKKLEPSPLNRLLKQAAPGNPWAMDSGHEIKFEYQTNKDGEVRLFKVSSTGLTSTGVYSISFLDSGTYPAKELYKTITYDENTTPGTKVGTEEFKNKEGQVVLKRSYESGLEHDTYYVYDNYGNLTYVLPPKVQGTISPEILNDLCYQYKYDYRNRLAEKKLPGKQWEFIVYDRLDRPVMTGPVFSPFKDDTTVGWMITKYDAFGRPIYTGWSSQAVSSEVRSTLQGTQNGTPLFEAKQGSASIDGISAYYTNLNAPTSFSLLTVNYYDDYAFPGIPTVPSAVIGQTVLANVKGLPTGSWARAVSTSSSLAGETTTIFYDKKARPIRTYLKNHLGGYTKTDSELDFSGKTLVITTEHLRSSGGTVFTTTDKFFYTAQDRLEKQTQTIAGVEQLLAFNEYDELGRLKRKNIGNTIGSPLQKVDFSYNIRGWLTEINKISNLGIDASTPDLFAFKINYNTPEVSNLAIPGLYNGNISETLWRTGSDDINRGYGYKYDNLNRLRFAAYEKNGDATSAYDENLTYDKNGNIATLIRYGELDTQAGKNLIDNLGYSYSTNTNRLISVVDNSNNTSGFNDINKTGDDYTYDFNGNMITDKNKNITAIAYNHLNLPKKITFGSAGSIEYIYNATGQKLEKNVTDGTVITNTNYLGGFQYKNNSLEFFPTAEGYVRNDSGVLKYVFQYKDHLGNVRLSFTKNAQNGVEIIEENNYYPFGLKHKLYNTAVTSTNSGIKYKYNGKELQDELGLGVYDYGGRNYDPALGRWMNIDPMAEMSRRWSPYNYAYNNPTRFIDPDGMLSQDAINEMISKSADDKETKWTNSGNGSFTNGTSAVAVNDEVDNFNEIGDSGGDIDPPKKKAGQPGSYTNTHESGKKYHGKGPKDRAEKSGKRIEKEYDDPLVDTDWTPATDDKQAFKDEDDRIKTDDGGHKSDNNYNKRRSPGEKIKEKELQEAANKAAKTGTAVVSAYIVYKIVAAILTWECFGCGALVVP